MLFRGNSVLLFYFFFIEHDDVKWRLKKNDVSYNIILIIYLESSLSNKR